MKKQKMNYTNKKLSIIIPNYNNEKYLKKSLNYLLAQSYYNLEIIVVNDGSKGNSDELMSEYLQKDKRIKYVKHEVNKGLFQARLTGADAATGDYIAFLDADDYASFDYYRTLMENATENQSDIVIGNTVLEYDDGRRLEYDFFQLDFKELIGKECLNEYFRQKGFVFAWHTVWNKVYSMSLWKKARKHYNDVKNRLIMTEDFAFSTVLFYYAQKVTKVENDAIFYCQHENTSTSVEDISYSKVTNNIKDLNTSFNFIEQFLKKVNIYEIYKENFLEWKHLYSLQHRSQINHAKKIKANEKVELNQLLDSYYKDKTPIENDWFFSSQVRKWDERLEKLKLQIADPNVKCVSFDIFDTLVLRPFLEPSDLFRFLDKEYRHLRNTNNGVSFSKIRIISEKVTRDEQFKKDPSIQEVTLDEIYKTIEKLYEIDTDICENLKAKEIEYELRFCSRRNTAYELYTLAKALRKKVICISDMYLKEGTILEILKKNGYTNIDKLYLSSVVRKTKWTGDLYQYACNDLKLKPEEIIHIGDNYESDYQRAKALGFQTCHFIKTTEIMTKRYYTNNLSQMLVDSLPFWSDTKESIRFLGIRSMLAVVANKYFDNPFRSFNKETDFNADPYLIGYYALGMYTFGITKWLISNMAGKYDKISFMARDGYLPMEAYKILKPFYKNLPEEEYMYVSRKALIPVIITNKLDFYKLSEIIEIEKQTPKKIVKYVSSIMNINEKELEDLCKQNGIDFEQKFNNIVEFNLYIKLLIDHFYNEEVHMQNRAKLKEYFDKILGEKPAVFDVGYSGRPEFYLTDLCKKRVDTFFLNINKDEALEYATLGNFNLYTYFASKPTATGNAYELLLSKLAPSCISYDCSKSEVKPVFEKYESNYQVEYIVHLIQNAALEFVRDMVTIFGEDLDLLYYQDYYITLPIMAYFNSANYADKWPLSVVQFEDDIRTGETRKMIDDMQADLDNKNQLELNKLFGKRNNIQDNFLIYNSYIDLSEKNKISRLLFYVLYDRETFKRRLSEITYRIRRK